MDTTTESPMKAARLAKGWTLRRLRAELEAVGVKGNSDGNLSRIEHGDVAPGPELRQALSQLLGIRPDQMKASAVRRTD